MVNFLFHPFFRFPIILIAEVVATVYLSRRRMKRRLSLIIGSYLGFIAMAIAFGLIAPDEFGFGFIPALLNIWPWYYLQMKLPNFVSQNLLGIVLLGASLNCAIFYIIDQLSYPKYSTKISDSHAT